MSDKSDARIRRKALRAARAVTMGAALMAAGCSGDAEEAPPSDGWGIGEQGDILLDSSADAAADAADIGPDIIADIGPDVVAEVGPTCSQGFDQICPEGCEVSNDADCCEADGLCNWYEGENGGCGCAVPGPFAPPSMIV